MFVEPRRNEESIGERFSRYVAASFQHGPFRSIGIDLLPLDCLGVPGLGRFFRPLWSCCLRSGSCSEGETENRCKKQIHLTLSFVTMWDSFCFELSRCESYR